MPPMVTWQWGCWLLRAGYLTSLAWFSKVGCAGTGHRDTLPVVPAREDPGSFSLPLFFSENEPHGLGVSWQGLLPE